MIYVGSKNRISKDIVPIIQKYIDENNIKNYYEPFCGGCNVIDKIKCGNKYASDNNKYLIALFQYLQNGGELPENITKEEHRAVLTGRDNFPDYYVGAVGFLASYRANFLSGYNGDYRRSLSAKNTYYQQAKNNINMQLPNLREVTFRCMDYRDLEVQGGLIYCDPPYGGTKVDYSEDRFNSVEFYNILHKWEKENIIIVSDIFAPYDWTCIFEKDINSNMRVGTPKKRTERMWVRKARR